MTPLPTVKYDGMQALTSGYAVDATACGLAYLSLIGPYAAVRALWAAMLDNRLIECSKKDAYFFRRIEEHMYRTLTQALPENQLTHLVIISNQATRYLTRGQPFYVLQQEHETENERRARFLGLLDLAAGIPTQPHWSGALWDAGVKKKLIEPCRTFGVQMWRVDTGEKALDTWLDILKQGVQKGALQ